MRIGLGVLVRTRDGQEVGPVDRVILDPANGAVRAAVIRKGSLVTRDIEVPLDALEAGPQGDLHLTYATEQLDDLPTFAERNYTTPLADAIPTADYPASSVLWPTGYVPAPALPAYDQLETADSATRQAMHNVARREALASAEISEGSAVYSRDGRQLGTVQQLAFDEISGQLIHILVGQGEVFGDDTALPASLIASAQDKALHLNVTAAEAGALTK